jgi:hypothetical protein
LEYTQHLSAGKNNLIFSDGISASLLTFVLIVYFPIRVVNNLKFPKSSTLLIEVLITFSD